MHIIVYNLCILISKIEQLINSTRYLCKDFFFIHTLGKPLSCNIWSPKLLTFFFLKHGHVNMFWCLLCEFVAKLDTKLNDIHANPNVFPRKCHSSQWNALTIQLLITDWYKKKLCVDMFGKCPKDHMSLYSAWLGFKDIQFLCKNKLNAY